MKLLALPADGIGPEIVSAAETVLSTADQKFNLQINLEHDIVGFESLEKFGITIRPEIIEKAKTFDGVILGTQSHADYPTPEAGGVKISASYRTDMDSVFEFLDEETVKEDGASVKKDPIYQAYRSWCLDNGHEPLNKNGFGTSLKAHGYVDGKSNKMGRYWKDIRLRKSLSIDPFSI